MLAAQTPTNRPQDRPAPEQPARARDGWRRASGWRPVVQGFFLLVFLYLTFSLGRTWQDGLPHDLFLRIDPLLWLVSSVAGREVAFHAGLALALMLGTALLGRVFCGWVCPLGTVIDATGAAVRAPRERSWLRRWLGLRFWVLGGLVGAAVLGLNLAGWVDPLALSTRALRMASLGKENALAIGLAGAMLAGAIGLTLMARRCWCRLLCPLGAALSLVARFAGYRRWRRAECIACGACQEVCPLAASPEMPPSGDCLVCHRCEAVCPQAAIRVAWRWPSHGREALPTQVWRVAADVRRWTGRMHKAFRLLTSAATVQGFKALIFRGILPSDALRLDGTRRRLLLVLGGLMAGGTLGLGARVLGRQAAPLRPPGAAVEETFVARCVACGACMAVCPTGGLVPLLRADRLEAAFSPELKPRLGPCRPECVACGAVCPTGAIPRLTPVQKSIAKIGVAFIDPERCLPWAAQERCVICVDACPPEWQAIELRRAGAGPFRPHVRAEQCTGCGVCEHRCPLQGRPAIHVVPVDAVRQ